MAAGPGYAVNHQGSHMCSGQWEISTDTQDEEKSINIAVSSTPIHTSSMWVRHNRNSVYIDLPHMCHNLSTHTSASMNAAGIVDKYMCFTTCVFVTSIGFVNSTG